MFRLKTDLLDLNNTTKPNKINNLEIRLTISRTTQTSMKIQVVLGFPNHKIINKHIEVVKLEIKRKNGLAIRTCLRKFA